MIDFIKVIGVFVALSIVLVVLYVVIGTLAEFFIEGAEYFSRMNQEAKERKEMEAQ